jgi:hypothetical protein
MKIFEKDLLADLDATERVEFFNGWLVIRCRAGIDA